MGRRSRALADFLVRFISVMLTRCFYRIKVSGIENVPVRGGTLLVPNHVTRLDALLLSAVTRRRIRFVMVRDVYNNRWLKPLFKLMQAIPVSSHDSPRQVVESLNQARQALLDGCLVCIFAEGAMTRNGNMREFRPGMARIVKGTDAPVLPVHIGGAWGSIFSYYFGRTMSCMPKKIPYPVTITIGEAMPTGSSPHEVRQAVLQLSGQEMDARKSAARTLPVLFARSARRNWFRAAVADSTGKRLSYGKLLIASFILADRLKTAIGDRRDVGIIMPATVGGALANTAVSLSGRVAVNLNFTVSKESFRSAIDQCDMSVIISSRLFMDKSGMEMPDGTLFLEDLLCRVSMIEKIRATLPALFMPARRIGARAGVGPDDLATIIFSSGSTGEPKGVMLSHHNVISNIESFSEVFRFTGADRMCSVLPFFHSFGYTCTMWCPLLCGFLSYFHPNPLDGAKVGEIVRTNKLTVLLSTPTFLLSYIRKAEPDDFSSLRTIVAGAEKLTKRIADAFERRFGIRPLEGYGTTELAPVASLNIPGVTVDGVFQEGTRDGSIGHPVPGVTMKITDPETGVELPVGSEGLLWVKGPNVMQGYLNRPGKTSEVLINGWYNTGDIARMDEDGFVFIVDRMSRFSKLGGEMVPHMAVEDMFNRAINASDRVVAVTAAPDERKGEQLVVFYINEAGDAEILDEISRRSDLPNLWKPRKDNYVRIEAIPTLGSGKLDLSRLRLMAREYVESKPGSMRKVVQRLRDAL